MSRTAIRGHLGVCRALLSAFCLVGFAANSVHAVLITNASALINPTVIDFSQFSGPFSFVGPEQIGGLVGRNVVWTGSDNSVIGNGGYALGSNRFWNSGRNGYTGTNSDRGIMTYRFLGGPVSGVGGFVNYSVDPPSAPSHAIIAALGASNQVLETYDLDLLAPIQTMVNDNDGAFRGILRNTPDIFAFQIGQQYAVLDNLTLSQVPEPSGLVLAALGFASLVACVLRRR